MTQDWRERLRDLLGRMADAVTTPLKGEKQNKTPAPLAINLGIDFGTSFTKVSFRDLGREESGIITFGADNLDSAMIRSVVVIDDTGNLSLELSPKARGNPVTVRYLKMRLAGVPLPGQLPVIGGVDLNEKVAVCALSSWFLATVLERAKAWLPRQEADRTKGRTIQWSANVGVPVEHFDSPAIDVFREVLAVAWTWAVSGNIPSRIDALTASYQETIRAIDQMTTDCHAIPEIAAAVQSFIVSREAIPGIYVYFDIGSGTVDGVAFNYLNWDGEKKINFYSGKVASLGVTAIASRLDAKNIESVEEAFVKSALDNALLEKLKRCSGDIQRLVGTVIMMAKKIDGRDWQKHKIQDASRPLKTLARLDASKMAPLIVFVGGGGAGSSWYQQSILSTHGHHKQINAGIPPYALTEVPKPSDLEMTGRYASDFRRFAIAYGLSVPYGEGPETGLPSQFDPPEPPKQWQSHGVVDYSDSKDAYD